MKKKVFREKYYGTQENITEVVKTSAKKKKTKVYKKKKSDK